MTAESIVENYTQSAINSGQQALENAIGAANEAKRDAATLFLFLDGPSTLLVPDIKLPNFNPNEDLAGLFDATFDDIINTIDPAFQKQIKNFLDKYFPEFTGCLKTAVPNWLCAVIRDGYSGIPASVENQIWQRERERLTEAYMSERDQAVNQWAGRGFAMPGGHLLDQFNRLEQGYQHEVAEASRTTAIKMLEIQVEMTKFAIEMAIRLRLEILQALISYLRLWMDEYRLAIDAAKAKIEAKTRLWELANAYIGALVRAEELKVQIREFNVNAKLKSQEIFTQAQIRGVQAKVDAAVGAAEALGKTAAAVLGAQNTLAHISHDTIQSQ